MTPARNNVPSAAEVTELRVKVEKAEERDREAREHIGKLFDRIDELKSDVSGVKLAISDEFGKLRAELAVQDERYKPLIQQEAGRSGAKWAAIVSSFIAFLAAIADKLIE